MSIAKQCYGVGFNGDGSHESMVKVADLMSDQAVAFAMANDQDLPESLVLNYAVTILNQRLNLRLRPLYVVDDDGSPVAVETGYTDEDFELFRNQKALLLERLVALSSGESER